jgi:hypothetical protein
MEGILGMKENDNPVSASSSTRDASHRQSKGRRHVQIQSNAQVNTRVQDDAGSLFCLSNVAAVGYQYGVPKRRGSSSSRGEWWRRVSLEEEHRGDWKLNYEGRARRTYQVPIDLGGINQEAGKSSEVWMMKDA